MKENISEPGNKGSLEEAYNKNLEEAIEIATNFNKEGLGNYQQNPSEEFLMKLTEQIDLINKKLAERVELIQKEGVENIKLGATKDEALEKARGLGFEGEISQNSNFKSHEGGWLKLEKDNVSYSLRYFPKSLSGDLRRIGILSARKNNERIALYMHTWFEPCADPEVQREIDKLIATLR